MQQLAANKAAQTAFGANAKWASWGAAKKGGAAGGAGAWLLQPRRYSAARVWYQVDSFIVRCGEEVALSCIWF